MSTHTLLSTAESLHRDFADRTCISAQTRNRSRIEMSRDIKTLRNRFAGEGNGFFTIACPRLHKHFLACVEEGSFSPLLGWKSRKGSKLPCFMHGWFERIFCPETGLMLEHVQAEDFLAVRQLLAFAGKAKELPKESACRKAITQFVETEDAIPQTLWSKSISIFGYSSASHDDLHLHVDHYWRNHGIYGQYFLASARTIGFEVLRGYTPELLRPKHGPGAVAEQYRPDGKWLHVTDHRSRVLSSVFPVDWTERPFFCEGEDYGNGSCLAEAAPPSRLILVPKTAVKPRLIAAEPTGNQFWQQALLGWMSDRFRMTWLRSSIDMADQNRSQVRAREGSANGSICTIDLTDASDTVTLDHVGALFPPGPFLQALLACRTQSIKLPDGGIHQLKKFATMGSAVCFPVESLVFLAATVAGMLVARKLTPTTRNIIRAAQACTVYGDDIIVPNDCASGSIASLTTLGFKPNVTKTFTKSKFRESCGGDFFDGRSVKPFYLREIPSERDGTHNTQLMSYCAFARHAYDFGLQRTGTSMFKYISRVLGTRLPFSEELEGFVSHNVPYWPSEARSRFNKQLQRVEFEAYASSSKRSNVSLDGPARLVRFLASTDQQVRRRRDAELRCVALNTSVTRRLAIEIRDSIKDQDWTRNTIRGASLKRKWIPQ